MNEPVTETMKISDVRSNLNTLVNEVYRREKRVIVEKSGIPVAAIISIDDFERLKRLRQQRDESEGQTRADQAEEESRD